MDNKKFEQLIDLIINENEEQARALFHDIVVEKSREIYEGMMDDEMGEGNGNVGTTAMSGKLYGYRAIADAATFAALTQSELLSA